MSLPDYLLDDEDDFCDGCGMPFNDDGLLCQDCRADICDMYADEKISAVNFHKRRVHDDVW